MIYLLDCTKVPYIICDPPQDFQHNGDNTGTLSVTSDTRMRIFNKETKSVTVAFVLHILTRSIFYFQQRVK